MNFCSWPENSFLIVSGHDWSLRHSGMKTPDIRRSIAPTGAPRTEPYCTTRPMFSAVIAAPAGLSRYSRSGTASCGSENCSDSPSTGSTKARRRRWFGDVRNSAIVSSCSTDHISGRSAGSATCAFTQAMHAASAADATVASPSGSAMVSGSSTSPWPPFPIAERAKRPPRRRFAGCAAVALRRVERPTARDVRDRRL